MKGIVNVRVSNARISFELRLERNITILSGECNRYFETENNDKTKENLCPGISAVR